ncbi:Acetylornithine deacetylase [Escherichia coli]|uniref:Acetylornithine deacetylase n=1 Tax=Escherichia coli TaxID=562 RepID=A0A376LF71_ECOLX|nr:Acetylornithine deacetylase [Escherichia coli]
MWKCSLCQELATNLICWQVTGQGAGGLLLAGHTDTVPFDGRTLGRAIRLH